MNKKGDSFLADKRTP